MHNILCSIIYYAIFNTFEEKVMNKKTTQLLPEEIDETMKQIGLRVTELRQQVDSNYKKFSETYNINNMTLWRMQKGKDYKMSSFLQVLRAIGCSPEEFFKGIR